MTLLLLLMAMSVQVNVYNKSVNKSPLSSQKVYLFGFTEEGKLSFQDSTFTDKRGRVTFDLKRGLIYIFQTDYKEIPYLSQAVDLTKDTVVKRVDLPVYETTRSQDSLSMVAGHLVLTRGNGTVYVTEMLALDNLAERTFIGGFYFVLPPGSGKTFSPAEPNAESDWSISGDTVFFVGPLYPGRRIVAFQYQLGGEGKIPIFHDLPIKAEVFRVLSSKGIKLTNSSLKYNKDMKIGKDIYNVYEGTNVASVSFTIGGTQFSWSLFIVALILVLFIAVFIFRKRIIPHNE